MPLDGRRVEKGDAGRRAAGLDQPLVDSGEAIERTMVMRALDRAHGNYDNARSGLASRGRALFLKRRRWGMQRAS